MLDEFINGIETDMINEIVLGATAFRFCVDTTVIVLAISAAVRETEGEKDQLYDMYLALFKSTPLLIKTLITHTNERE